MGLMAKGTRCVTGLVCSLLGWWILYKNKTPENIVDSKGECGVALFRSVILFIRVLLGRNIRTLVPVINGHP